ncbi:MAG TPA: lysylphosphatidylglycerol synthase transmembrane domain-containing protein [Thermomicrobiales bacterium]|nr:lysylphosphatidylglycerol synthase transmembrane domain-containing protein [Thermomicrobiales bacterium]
MRRFILIIIATAVLAAAIFYVDFSTLWSALAGLSTTTIVLLAVLLLAGALVKSLRWAFFLRAADLDISWRDGMTTYLAGMAAGAIPGGSWLPARLAQEHGSVRMRQAVSGLFVGFVADMIALAILAGTMILVMGEPRPRLLIPVAAIALAILLIAMGRSERLWYFIDRLLARSRFTSGLLPKEADIHQKISAVMRTTVVGRGVGFSLMTTTVSVCILYLLVNGLTFTGISVRQAYYVHSFSESAATVIPSPGGIGVIDSSMAGLLNSLSIGWVRATFVVLTIRSIDLLFKTVFGSVMLVVFYHRLLRDVLQFKRRARRVGLGAWRAWRFSWRFATRQNGTPSHSATTVQETRQTPPPSSRDNFQTTGVISANTTTHPANRVHPSAHHGSPD